MPFSDKVAIVIGAGAGIGRAYALALAAQGATVIAVARTLGAADDAQRNTLAHLAQSAASASGRIFVQACDVLDEATVRRTIDQTAINFGRIDVLVNNAALMTLFDPFDIPTDDWDRIMRLNVRAPYVAMSAVAPHMKRQRSGSIINITARAGEFMSRGTQLHDGTLLYGVTKAALNRLSFFMAEELKPFGIAVNALSPGVVATDTALQATPALRDYGAKEPTADVLGPALLYLARQRGGTLTGQILHTDRFGESWGQEG
jgi:NAD(P)-dependent dehydrogenase (short-subunit alcohol dehydrogenase family)